MLHASLWGHLGHTLLCHQCSSFWYANRKQDKMQTVLGHGLSPQKFRKLKQEYWEFKASLGSFVSPTSSLKNQNVWECS